MKQIIWGMVLCLCLFFNGFQNMRGEGIVLVQASLYQGFSKEDSHQIVEGAVKKREKERKIEKKKHSRLAKQIENMTLEEKLSQLMILTNPKDITIEKIRAIQPGGIIFFSADFNGKSIAQVRNRVDSLQNVCKYPMFVCVDEEGGSVSRVKGLIDQNIPSFSGARVLGNQHDKASLREQTSQKMELLKRLGLNVNFDPVADVVTANHSYMYMRSAGGDAKTVSWYVKQVVMEMKKQDVISCMKHFPGYGDNGNTHANYIVDQRSMEEYREKDLKPFRVGIRAGADMVMVSHIVMESIDKQNPASLSKPAHELLRNDLAFDGIILSDDLNMRAILDKMTLEEASAKAIEAGNDMIFSADYDASLKGMKKSVEKGTISMEQIDQSVFRVLKMKADHGMILQRKGD